MLHVGMTDRGSPMAVEDRRKAGGSPVLFQSLQRREASTDIFESRRSGFVTDRAASSIPSVHGGHWTFPSADQFLRAVRRKGHENLTPENVDVVLQIHNAVNERCWEEILKYEGLHSQVCSTPKLLRFIGRPGEKSLKARYMESRGYAPPFDRHDWYVDRCGHRTVRYLVDFYDGASPEDSSSSHHSSSSPVSIFVDARPELSFGGAFDRLSLYLKQRFSATS